MPDRSCAHDCASFVFQLSKLIYCKCILSFRNHGGSCRVRPGRVHDYVSFEWWEHRALYGCENFFGFFSVLSSNHENGVLSAFRSSGKQSIQRYCFTVFSCHVFVGNNRIVPSIVSHADVEGASFWICVKIKQQLRERFAAFSHNGFNLDLNGLKPVFQFVGGWKFCGFRDDFLRELCDFNFNVQLFEQSLDSCHVVRTRYVQARDFFFLDFSTVVQDTHSHPAFSDGEVYFCVLFLYLCLQALPVGD